MMDMIADHVAQRASSLTLMREPFKPNQISKLPKPTKAQTDAVKDDFKSGVRCEICGLWHHPKVVHLDYVGHAALTDRLLDCDPEWAWEPVAVNDDGTPKLDHNGGMWIRLTVCGVTRLGYGHADGKSGGDAVKEVIGDALRNAAMRFGAALDLWHKGDLHADEDAQQEPAKSGFDPGPHVDAIKSAPTGKDLLRVIPGEHAKHPAINTAIVARLRDLIATIPSVKALEAMGNAFDPVWDQVSDAVAERTKALTKDADLGADHVPF